MDCPTYSVGYDMVLSVVRGHPKLDLIRSPTTLQHGRYGYKELDVGYDKVQTVSRGHPKLDLIRSPTTLQHGRYGYEELE
eukprot:scaffold28376_cov175-Skeletonema_marinoi.AAC.1